MSSQLELATAQAKKAGIQAKHAEASFNDLKFALDCELSAIDVDVLEVEGLTSSSPKLRPVNSPTSLSLPTSPIGEATDAD